MTDVTMPQLGETVTEGTITRWFKQVGDKVAADEALFEVSTDKVDSEVPAPAAGYLAEIRVVEGDTVDVGATLAVLSDEPPGGGGGAGGAQEAEAPVDEAPVAPDESGSGEGRSEEAEQARVMSPSPPPSPSPPRRPAAPVLRRWWWRRRRRRGPARRGCGTAGPTTAGAGLTPVVPGCSRRWCGAWWPSTASTPTPSPGPAPVDGSPATTSSPSSRPVTAGPPRSVPGSFPRRPSAPPTPARAPSTTGLTRRAGDEVVPFSNMRRRTAEHMIRSKATSAHTLVVLEVDYEGVDRVRLAAKDRFKAEEGVNLTYLPFVSRAVVDALRGSLT